MENVEIRKAQPSDLERLTEIYNQAILKRDCTCHLETFTPQERVSWLHEHESERYPLFVCVLDGKTVGYAHLSPYKTRQAFDSAVEVTYYLDYDYRRRGLGSLLLELLLKEAKRLGYRTATASIIGSNIASEKLLLKFGFEEWGRLPQIADFGDRLEDHVFFGKYL